MGNMCMGNPKIIFSLIALEEGCSCITALLHMHNVHRSFS